MTPIDIENTAARLRALNADLGGAAFTDVNLAEAVFQDVNLREASFSNVSLHGATLSNLDLRGASFTDARIDSATIFNGTLLVDLLRSGEGTFQSVSPIGDTDPLALPVREIDAAVGYYACVLGFTPIERDKRQATLERDGVRIGLSVDAGDPEQASVYFAVSDVDAVREELGRRQIAPTPVGRTQHGGRSYRVFFAKEPYGVCFCFGQEAPTDAVGGEAAS